MGEPTVIRAPLPGEREWIERVLRESWGSTTIVSRGLAHDAARLPALVAARGSALAGLATLRFDGGQCELVSLDALRRGEGIGSALLAAAAEEATRAGARRLWLVTSNDNLEALRFYQRRGMTLVAVHRGAIEEARRLKPGIPAVGAHGIPVRDEIELERQLG